MSKIFPINFPIDAAHRMYSDGIGKYWFYHKEDFPTVEPLKYREIIKSAVRSIDILDPYFNIYGTKTDYQIFDNIRDNIKIRILTVKKMLKVININFLNDTLNSIKSVVTAANTEFGMRVINLSEAGEQIWEFHDRFLLIDNTDLYIVGGSIGYHVYSENSTGIYKVDDSETLELVTAIYEYYWGKGRTNEIPIQFLHP